MIWMPSDQPKTTLRAYKTTYFARPPRGLTRRRIVPTIETSLLGVDVSAKEDHVQGPRTLTGPGACPAAKIRSIVAVVTMAVFCCHLSAAETDCTVENLSRESSAEGRLAVRSVDGWTLFNQKEPGILKISPPGHNDLCLAWEAPPYDGARKQIVYVSSRFSDNQPVSVYRNASSPPFLYPLFSDWQGTTVERNFFREFHAESSDQGEAQKLVGTNNRHKLLLWHQTSFWFPNMRSDELVKGALKFKGTSLPNGAERLLVVAAGRAKKSWIPFTSKVQRGSELLVTIAYSGDKEPFLYEYTIDTE